MSDSLAQRAITEWQSAEAEAKALNDEREAEAAHKACAQAEMFLVKTLGDLVGTEGHHWTPIQIEPGELVAARTRIENVMIQYQAAEDRYSDKWSEGLYVVGQCLNEQCANPQVLKTTRVGDLVTLGRALVQKNTFNHQPPNRSKAYQCNGIEIRYFPQLEEGTQPPITLTEPEGRLIEALREMTTAPEENPHA